MIAYGDTSVGAGDIYTVLVNPDGSARGAAIAVEPTPAASSQPSIVATDGGYMVVWEEGTAGQAVYAHAIDKIGNPVGQGVTVASTSAPQARPVMSRAPGGIAIAWIDSVLGQAAVQLALLDGSMHVHGPARVAESSGGASFPSLAGSDQGAAIAWSDHRSGHYDVRFSPIDTSNMALENDVPLRASAPRDALLPRMIPTSSGYLAAWEDLRADDNQIYMALTDTNGGSLYEGLVEEPNSGDANWPNMAWNGSAAGVVFYQFRDANPQVFITFVDASGARIGPPHDYQVSQAPRGQARFPDIQFDGTDFGVAWLDSRGGPVQLYFARVACAR